MAEIQKLKLLLLLRLRSRFRKKCKKMWVRRIFQEREDKSEYHILVKDLVLFDHEYFFKSFRMNPETFEQLLSLVAPFITKSSERRPVASAAERLCVTLKHLCTGDSHVTLATSYRISPPVIGRIIKETCAVIWNVLMSRDVFKAPSNFIEWLKIAEEFENKWNFPHCLGAIDGKHVVIQAPQRSGSMYFNYKKTHSIVMLAVCDANYKFILADVGDNGRQSDGGVYASSKLGYAIDHNLLDFPSADFIKGSQNAIKYPYVFVADDAFSMKSYLIKPYPGKCNDMTKTICNYRISRARRCIENAFGILATRFRIYRKPIASSIETTCNIVKATLVLHNFLMSLKEPENNSYSPDGFADKRIGNNIRLGEWRNEIGNVTGIAGLDVMNKGSNNYSNLAKEVRNAFKDYFNSPAGAVQWQNEVVSGTKNKFDI